MVRANEFIITYRPRVLGEVTCRAGVGVNVAFLVCVERTLLSAAFDVDLCRLGEDIDRELKTKGNTKTKIKGGGQECPPYMGRSTTSDSPLISALIHGGLDSA
jgi:hypothetical protein